MTTTTAVLLEAAFATADGVSYISANCSTMIDKITATNVGTDIETATVQLVSPDGAQSVAYKKAILPGATWPFPEVVGHVLAPGGKMNVISPGAGVICARASGRQIT